MGMTMGGYKRSRTVGLKFGPDDGDMAGFEVTLRRLNVDQILDVAELADIPADASYAEQKKIISELSERVGEQIVAWNLLDEDNRPIPPSPAALRAEDVGFVLVIVNRWVEEIASVAAPLARPSSAGAPSPAVSIPMEVLLPSPPPLPALS